MSINTKHGFTVLEIMVTLIVISILAAVSIKPITGILNRIKLQNSADGIKQILLNARSRAVSNSNLRVGVVFNINASPSIDDSIFAFFDDIPAGKTKGDDKFTAGVDKIYGSYFVIQKNRKISTAIPSGYPSTIVFRGDASANASAKLIVTLGQLEDTVSVLASTGKVKVKVKVK